MFMIKSYTIKNRSGECKDGKGEVVFPQLPSLVHALHNGYFSLQKRLSETKVLKVYISKMVYRFQCMLCFVFLVAFKCCLEESYNAKLILLTCTFMHLISTHDELLHEYVFVCEISDWFGTLTANFPKLTVYVVYIEYLSFEIIKPVLHIFWSYTILYLRRTIIAESYFVVEITTCN